MTVLILGATSDVAIAMSRLMASLGYNLQVAGRDTENLKALKSDIEVRHGVSVLSIEFDALNFESHSKLYHDLPTKPDIVILVFGYLGSQEVASSEWKESERILATNYVGAVSILNVISNDFEERRHGMIVGISSVAGDRGRMSNYLYGSAKAGLSAYLSGLRNRLYHSNVHVLTVKPGFIITQMTEGLKLPPIITATPEQVAKHILKAITRKKNIIYVLPIWFLIMLIIRNIPEFLFKKLKL